MNKKELALQVASINWTRVQIGAPIAIPLPIIIGKLESLDKREAIELLLDVIQAKVLQSQYGSRSEYSNLLKFDHLD